MSVRLVDLPTHVAHQHATPLSWDGGSVCVDCLLHALEQEDPVTALKFLRTILQSLENGDAALCGILGTAARTTVTRALLSVLQASRDPEAKALACEILKHVCCGSDPPFAQGVFEGLLAALEQSAHTGTRLTECESAVTWLLSHFRAIDPAYCARCGVAVAAAASAVLQHACGVPPSVDNLEPSLASLRMAIAVVKVTEGENVDAGVRDSLTEAAARLALAIAGAASDADHASAARVHAEALAALSLFAPTPSLRKQIERIPDLVQITGGVRVTAPAAESALAAALIRLIRRGLMSQNGQEQLGAARLLFRVVEAASGRVLEALVAVWDAVEYTLDALRTAELRPTGAYCIHALLQLAHAGDAFRSRLSCAQLLACVERVERAGDQPLRADLFTLLGESCDAATGISCTAAVREQLLRAAVAGLPVAAPSGRRTDMAGEDLHVALIACNILATLLQEAPHRAQSPGGGLWAAVEAAVSGCSAVAAPTLARGYLAASLDVLFVALDVGVLDTPPRMSDTDIFGLLERHVVTACSQVVTQLQRDEALVFKVADLCLRVLHDGPDSCGPDTGAPDGGGRAAPRRNALITAMVAHGWIGFAVARIQSLQMPEASQAVWRLALSLAGAVLPPCGPAGTEAPSPPMTVHEIRQAMAGGAQDASAVAAATLLCCALAATGDTAALSRADIEAALRSALRRPDVPLPEVTVRVLVGCAAVWPAAQAPAAELASFQGVFLGGADDGTRRAVFEALLGGVAASPGTSRSQPATNNHETTTALSTTVAWVFDVPALQDVARHLLRYLSTLPHSRILPTTRALLTHHGAAKSAFSTIVAACAAADPSELGCVRSLVDAIERIVRGSAAERSAGVEPRRLANEALLSDVATTAGGALRRALEARGDALAQRCEAAVSLARLAGSCCRATGTHGRSDSTGDGGERHVAFRRSADCVAACAPAMTLACEFACELARAASASSGRGGGVGEHLALLTQACVCLVASALACGIGAAHGVQEGAELLAAAARTVSRVPATMAAMMALTRDSDSAHHVAQRERLLRAFAGVMQSWVLLLCWQRARGCGDAAGPLRAAAGALTKLLTYGPTAATEVARSLADDALAGLFPVLVLAPHAAQGGVVEAPPGSVGGVATVDAVRRVALAVHAGLCSPVSLSRAAAKLLLARARCDGGVSPAMQRDLGIRDLCEGAALAGLRGWGALGADSVLRAPRSALVAALSLTQEGGYSQQGGELELLRPQRLVEAYAEASVLQARQPPPEFLEDALRRVLPAAYRGGGVPGWTLPLIQSACATAATAIAAERSKLTWLLQRREHAQRPPDHGPTAPQGIAAAPTPAPPHKALTPFTAAVPEPGRPAAQQAPSDADAVFALLLTSWIEFVEGARTVAALEAGAAGDAAAGARTERSSRKRTFASMFERLACGPDEQQAAAVRRRVEDARAAAAAGLDGAARGVTGEEVGGAGAGLRGPREAPGGVGGSGSPAVSVREQGAQTDDVAAGAQSPLGSPAALEAAAGCLAGLRTSEPHTARGGEGPVAAGGGGGDGGAAPAAPAATPSSSGAARKQKAARKGAQKGGGVCPEDCFCERCWRACQGGFTQQDELRELDDAYARAEELEGAAAGGDMNRMDVPVEDSGLAIGATTLDPEGRQKDAEADADRQQSEKDLGPPNGTCNDADPPPPTPPVAAAVVPEPAAANEHHDNAPPAPETTPPLPAAHPGALPRRRAPSVAVACPDNAPARNVRASSRRRRGAELSIRGTGPHLCVVCSERFENVKKLHAHCKTQKHSNAAKAAGVASLAEGSVDVIFDGAGAHATVGPVPFGFATAEAVAFFGGSVSRQEGGVVGPPTRRSVRAKRDPGWVAVRVRNDTPLRRAEDGSGGCEPSTPVPVGGAGRGGARAEPTPTTEGWVRGGGARHR